METKIKNTGKFTEYNSIKNKMESCSNFTELNGIFSLIQSFINKYNDKVINRHLMLKYDNTVLRLCGN